MNLFLNRYLKLGQTIDESSFNVERRQCIRINPLKISDDDLLKRLKKKGVKFTKVSFLDHGYYFESEFSLGSTEEYLLGYYYMQEAASQVPVQLLDLKNNDVVLDMCSAPGSKTSQISAELQNTGSVVALDTSKKRLYSLKNNLERTGSSNVLIYAKDAQYADELTVSFDKVLLDAPCSGNFVIDKDWLTKRNVADFVEKSRVQKELLRTASRVLKKGGVLVYSTCSLEPEEDEMVVDWALKNLSLELVDTKLDVGDKGLTEVFDEKLDASVSKCRRFWPWKTQTQGFFVAKFVKK